MLSYYVLYKKEIHQGSPVGIIILETRHGEAIIWNHRSKAWQYDPETAQEFLSDDRNLDRYHTVDRATAEQVTPQVTDGRSTLPDEATIRWILQRKGIPQEGDER